MRLFIGWLRMLPVRARFSGSDLDPHIVNTDRDKRNFAGALAQIATGAIPKRDGVDGGFALSHVTTRILFELRLRVR